MEYIKHFKFGMVICIPLLIVSCILANPPANPANPPKSDSYLDERNSKDEDRGRILRNARDKKDGRDCVGNDVCEKKCRDIYSRVGERRECEELSIGQVERIEDIYKTLKRPSLSSLKDIDVSDGGDFDVFVNIDIRPLQSVVGRYKENAAEDMLAWIAKYEDVATIFRKEDVDFEILSDLLGELSSNDFSALGENIANSNTFMDLAVEADNEVALRWIHKYLEQENTKCKDDDDDDKRAECLEGYCEIARDMDDDNAVDLLGFEYFQGYLDDIIDDGINGCRCDTYSEADDECKTITPRGCAWDNYSDIRIEETDDLQDWWIDLC